MPIDSSNGLYQPLYKPILESFPELGESDFSFTPAPKIELGDVALRTFEAARKLKIPPPQFASRIASEVNFGPEVLEINVTGPYLNFKLNRSSFSNKIVKTILEEADTFGSNHSGRGHKVLLEHTSINPNASPHVGRARNAMIGDSLARMLRFEDYDVEVHYYVNDMGKQIGLLVLTCDDLENLSFDDILEKYVAANERAKEDSEFSEAGYELLVKMEQGDEDTQKSFTAVTDLCLKGQLGVLERIGATYDVFDKESKYIKDDRLNKLLDALRERDAVFVDEDERLVVDLSKIGHEYEEGRYFVLMRANGSSMYGYRDLAYNIDKLEKCTEKNIIVLGEDHKLYAQQLALILKTIGLTAPEAVHYSYILLKEGKMSTRQGKVVLLSDFLDEATLRSEERVREQCTDLEPDEQRSIAQKVAVAAIRFAVLRVSPNKNVIFDWDTCLSFSGDTGPYIQYSCARINSILRKYGELPDTVSDDFPVETDTEWGLLTKLADFPDAVSSAVTQRNCAPVAQFALDAARAFTSFYHDCPVLQAETDAQCIARAQVCAVTLITLKNALELLGIEAPKKM